MVLTAFSLELLSAKGIVSMKIVDCIFCRLLTVTETLLLERHVAADFFIFQRPQRILISL